MIDRTDRNWTALLVALAIVAMAAGCMVLATLAARW